MVYNDQYSAVESAPEVLADNIWHHPTRKIRICMDALPLSEIPTRSVGALKAEEPFQVHGILLGNAVSGDELSVLITEVEFLPPQVNPADPSALGLGIAAALARRTGNHRARPLGYFRSHLQEGLSLTEQDRAIVTKYFPDPSSVVILVRPFEMGICMAGFFFWENGRLQGEYTDFEVPMFASDHAPATPNPQLFGGTDAEAPAFVRVPEKLEPVKTVPVTPKAEQPGVEPPTSPDQPLKAVEKRVEERPPIRSVSQTDAVDSRKQAIPDRQAAPRPQSSGSERPVAPAQTNRVHPAEVSLIRRSRDTRGTTERSTEKWLFGVRPQRVALAFIIIAGVATAVYFGTVRFRPGVQVLTSAAPNSQLGLQIARPAAGQLDLTWNRTLPPTATAGELTISDGTLRRTLTLSPAQLQSGKLAYFPVGTDLSFQLKVFVQNAQPLTEFVQVLVPSDAGAQNGVFAGLTKAFSAVTNRSTASAVPAGRKPTGARTTDQHPDVRATSHPPNPAREAVNAKEPADTAPVISLPSPSEGGQTVGGAPVSAKLEHQSKIDAPPTIGADVLPGETPVEFSKLNLDLPVPVKSPPPAMATRMAPQTPGSATRVPQPPSGEPATIYVEPQPMRRVMPDIRTLLPGGVTAATRVEVDVKIDKTGHVTAAEAINGNSLLVGSSVSAAKQWIFRPAKLRGEPVASSHRIVFEFQPGR